MIKFYDTRGFFDEEKLIELKIENLLNKGYSIKKIKLFLKRNFFDERLIIEKIKDLELESDLEEKLIDKYLSKSGLSKKIKINMDKSDIEKILKKLLLQGFNYNQIVKYLKEKHNLYDYS